LSKVYAYFAFEGIKEHAWFLNQLDLAMGDAYDSAQLAAPVQIVNWLEGFNRPNHGN
jgi:hypothetical protein